MIDYTYKLSILVPVYNVEQYLERCLESVFSQTDERCEVILVDDGSTDNSGQICDRYQLKYPSQCRVYHKENQGAYPTRNYALDRANGEYLWFIDPDDYIEPKSIESLRLIIAENNNPDIIIAAYRRCTDTWTGEIENQEQSPHIVSGEEYLVEGYFKIGYLWNHIYRHAFITQKNLRFNDKLYTQGDSLFNAYAYVVAKRIFLSDIVIYNYYQGNPNSTLARRDINHLLRGVDNSMIAELEMHQLCESQKGTAVYEPLSKRLALEVTGFFYSLYRFPIPISVVRNALKVYKEHGLYPVKRSDNRRANIFRTFANCKWLFLAVCQLQNLIYNGK